jgi:transcriptional regulator with XRE-family HTH domain
VVSCLADFGHRIRSLRRAQGLTQEQLAEAADLNPRTVQKIEAGKINIVLTTLLRLQAALRCSVGELFDDETVLVMHDRRPSLPSTPADPGHGPEAKEAPPFRYRWARRNGLG